MLLGIVPGLLVGSLACAVMAWIFVATRAPRKTRRISVIVICYLAFFIPSIGSLLLLMEVLDIMGISRTSAGDVATGTYTLAIAVGCLLIFRSEMRWRKQSGISK